MEQQTGSQLGKEYVKAVYCHPVIDGFHVALSFKKVDLMISIFSQCVLVNTPFSEDKNLWNTQVQERLYGPDLDSHN